jgi:hypothetical protein
LYYKIKKQYADMKWSMDLYCAKDWGYGV